MENIWENIQAGRVNIYQCPGRVGVDGKLAKGGGNWLGICSGPFVNRQTIAHVATDQSPGPSTYTISLKSGFSVIKWSLHFHNDLSFLYKTPLILQWASCYKIPLLE